jgi:CheY-like chemotaxis protein
LPKRVNTVFEADVLSGKSILLVEDNEMNRLLATTLLEQFGARVTEAENGEVAIEALKGNDDFDLILMDIQMPVKGGLEATREIREHVNKHIPIVALTANAFKEEEEKCLKAGMNDFISKPFEEQKMIQVIVKCLGMNVTNKEEKSGEEQLTNLYDLKKLHTISRGDIGFINKMLGLFVTTIPVAMQQIQAGFDDRNMDIVASVAHRIKPSIHNMCIVSLNDDILLLESARDADFSFDNGLVIFNKLKAVLEAVVTSVKEDLK